MPHRPLEEFLTSALPDHCYPENGFLTRISSDFHTCMPTSLSFLSTVLGSLSILAWLFAQLPQIFKNYNLQSTAGLSIYFLVVWCLGDTTNLLGAILTKQAAWQIVVAGYYVCVDIALVSQYFWYTYRRGWGNDKPHLHENGRDGSEGTDGDILNGVSITGQGSPQRKPADDTDKSSKPRLVPFSSFRFPYLSSTPTEKGSPSSCDSIHIRSGPVATPSPKALLLISILCAVLGNASPLPVSPFDITASETATRTEFIGRLLSWTSTLLYLGSRLPQLYKNHTRRSTSGLSASLFIAAFFGNLFYSTSLLTNPLAWASYPPYGAHGWVGAEGSNRAEWLSLAAPFWLGAAGVLGLDAAVGAQFLMFGEGEVEKGVVEVRDRQGKSHWRKVSGYMRGWWPGEVSNDNEHRALLTVDADSEERAYGGLSTNS